MTLNSLSWPLAEWMTARRATLIWLVVSVPVLSEQITVVQPSVSTDGRLHKHHIFADHSRKSHKACVVSKELSSRATMRHSSWMQVSKKALALSYTWFAYMVTSPSVHRRGLPHAAHTKYAVICATHLRTMAFLFAILRVPRARQVVTTAGSPSGMAATASATAILK